MPKMLEYMLDKFKNKVLFLKIAFEIRVERGLSRDVS